VRVCEDRVDKRHVDVLAAHIELHPQGGAALPRDGVRIARRVNGPGAGPR